MCPRTPACLNSFGCLNHFCIMRPFALISLDCAYPKKIASYLNVILRDTLNDALIGVLSCKLVDIVSSPFTDFSSEPGVNANQTCNHGR